MLKKGSTAYLKVKGMAIQVEIVDVRSAYGRTRYQVTPVAGKGSAVVEDLQAKPTT